MSVDLNVSPSGVADVALTKRISVATISSTPPPPPPPHTRPSHGHVEAREHGSCSKLRYAGFSTGSREERRLCAAVRASCFCSNLGAHHLLNALSEHSP